MRKKKAIALAALITVAAVALAKGRQASTQRATATGTVAQLAGIAAGRTRVIDMTYTINGKLPAWPGDNRTFEAQVVATPQKEGYFARSFWMLEHYGTHLDAPAHFPPGKTTLDQLPVSHFFGPAVVIDVRAEAAKNADYRLTSARVKKWEAAHGRIPAGAIVLLRTGWASRWPDQGRYRNMDAQGAMHFPGFSVDGAKLLIARGAVGLGIDTLSVDYGPSKDFEVHRVDLPAGLYNLENLANLDQLPEIGAYLIVAPIKIEGGSGGPVRVFAILPDQK
ncbi:MAG TPA: cyclase family protein [Candidatus Polarisedimenticolia bacterium]|nr:cyclase family protein [Candidatus Polarisedimenticolia bacterium]